MNEIFLRKYLLSNLKGRYNGTENELRSVIDTAIRWAENQSYVLEYITDELRQRIVHFKYAKVDGTIREAWGTLKESLIERSSKDTLGSKNSCPNYVTYFDLTKNEWRCFKVANFLEILQ